MPDLQAGLPSGTSVWCQPGERFNTWSHLAALLVGVVASVGLICETVAGGDARKIAGSVVFGLSLAALFGASALFHGCTGARKRFWQRVDHACIYLLIAGSHTPFALMAPSGLWAWPLLAGVWVFALQGAIRALGFDSPPRLSLYISLGWLSLGARCRWPCATVRRPWPGCSRADCSIRQERCSTEAFRACAIRMASGTCSWLPAAPAIPSRWSVCWPEARARAGGAALDALDSVRQKPLALSNQGLESFGRSGGIRTRDPLLPKQR